MTTSSPEKIAAAFNEWKRRSIEEPERFEHESTSIIEFLRAEDAGIVPSYGARCQAYLAQILTEGIA